MTKVLLQYELNNTSVYDTFLLLTAIFISA